MNVSGLNFIIDQILGQLQVFPEGKFHEGQLVEYMRVFPGGEAYKKANYPSKHRRPCNLRIYEHKNSFLLRGIDEETRKKIILSIRCNPLSDKSLLKTRRKNYRRARDFAEQKLEYKNLIVIEKRRINQDDLRLLAGIYLARDGVIERNDIWELFEEFIRKSYRTSWQDGGTPFEVFHEYLLKNFKIPTSIRAFRSYLCLIWKKEIKNNLPGIKIDQKILESKFSNEQNEIENPYVTPSMNVPESTKYEWMKLGKIKGVKRKGWRYELPDDFEEQIEKLAEKKEEKRLLAEMARSITAEGQKVKSTQRKLQRWRKRGLSIEEISIRLGLVPA